MDFLGMGMGEIVLILIVALLIWGPGKVPEIARTVGRFVYTLRKTTSDLTTAVTKEINMEEPSQPPLSRANSNQPTRELTEPSDVAKAAPGTTEVTRPKDQSAASNNNE